MSASVLNQRLAELREADVVSQSGEGGYELTREGGSLLDGLGALDAWAKRWDRRSAKQAAAARSSAIEARPR